MIIKKIRSKGKLIMKRSRKGDNLYYVQTKLNGKNKRLLIKDASNVISKLMISPEFLPRVYGEVILYSESFEKIQNIKFRIKGIDKYYKKRSHETSTAHK